VKQMTSATKGIRKYRAPITLNAQPAHYATAEAKQGYESEKRRQLREWHEKDARTPLTGCQCYSEEERAKLRAWVRSGQGRFPSNGAAGVSR
jgi:hypothetical protein